MILNRPPTGREKQSMENKSSLPNTFEAPAGLVWKQAGTYALWSTNIGAICLSVQRYTDGSISGHSNIPNAYRIELTARSLEDAGAETFREFDLRISKICAAFAAARTQTPLPDALTEPPDVDEPQSHACSGCQTPCGCSNTVCMGCGSCQDRGDWGYRPKR